jgi:predicted nucleotidyltransferase
MQQISSFSDRDSAAVLRAVSQIESPESGFKADSLFMERCWYLRFTWPDWPKQRAKALAQEVNKFCGARPELHPVQQGSREWASVSHGWEADYESAEAIGDRFNRCFQGRVNWVESEKDHRGRIAAECSVEEVGEFQFDLSWRSSSIQPLAALKAEQYDAFREAGRQIMEWAASRIQPILDALKAKLQELYGDRFRGLYVFGSYARPDAGIKLPIDSDLDVAVVLTDFEDRFVERDRVSDVVADLSLTNDIVISLIPIREADYNEGRTNFTRVISEYAVPVRRTGKSHG